MGVREFKAKRNHRYLYPSPNESRGIYVDIPASLVASVAEFMRVSMASPDANKIKWLFATIDLRLKSLERDVKAAVKTLGDIADGIVVQISPSDHLSFVLARYWGGALYKEPNKLKLVRRDLKKLRRIIEMPLFDARIDISAYPKLIYYNGKTYTSPSREILVYQENEWRAEAYDDPAQVALSSMSSVRIRRVRMGIGSATFSLPVDDYVLRNMIQRMREYLKAGKAQEIVRQE